MSGGMAQSVQYRGRHVRCPALEGKDFSAAA